jgi:hypothetical protein
MQCLQIPLRLDRHKTHPGSLHRFGNRFRIDLIALVRLHIRLHVLSRHQAHVVPLRSQSLPQEMCSTAGFHAGQVHLQIPGEGEQLCA